MDEADPKPEYKMYCIVSREALAKMGGNRGKMMTMGEHAILHTYWDAEARFPEAAHAYRTSQAAVKVNLVAETDADLDALHAAYKDRCGVSYVIDAGRTVFGGPTKTFLGIGPIRSDQRDEDLVALRPFI